MGASSMGLIPVPVHKLPARRQIGTCRDFVIFRDLTTSILGRGKAGQSDVRESSLKQDFKFDAVGTH
jgi:hypothetical protein